VNARAESRIGGHKAPPHRCSGRGHGTGGQAPMHDEPYRCIPLHARDGSVRAYAIVDEADFAQLSRWQWHLTAKGYACRAEGRRPDRVQFWMHRVVLGLEPSDPRCADHRNRDKLDNRRSNLRAVTDAQNHQNLDVRRTSTIGYRGVTRAGRAGDRFMARAGGHERQYLGVFDTAEEAAEAAAAHRRAHMPFSTERSPA
jgi:hypothetical protein